MEHETVSGESGSSRSVSLSGRAGVFATHRFRSAEGRRAAADGAHSMKERDKRHRTPSFARTKSAKDGIPGFRI